MEKEILKKLEGHDKQFEKLDKKLEEHDKQFEKLDKKLEEHDKQFARNEEVHSNLTKKLLEHDDKFDEIKDEIRETKNELLTKMDQILGVVKRSEDERIVGTHRMDRMQGEIDKNEKEIKGIKKVLKIA